MNEKVMNRQLTYKGPTSHLLATGARMNHNKMTPHILRLIENNAIKRTSTQEGSGMGERVRYLQNRSVLPKQQL